MKVIREKRDKNIERDEIKKDYKKNYSENK